MTNAKGLVKSFPELSCADRDEHEIHLCLTPKPSPKAAALGTKTHVDAGNGQVNRNGGDQSNSWEDG